MRQCLITWFRFPWHSLHRGRTRFSASCCAMHIHSPIRGPRKTVKAVARNVPRLLGWCVQMYPGARRRSNRPASAARRPMLVLLKSSSLRLCPATRYQAKGLAQQQQLRHVVAPQFAQGFEAAARGGDQGRAIDGCGRLRA